MAVNANSLKNLTHKGRPKGSTSGLSISELYKAIQKSDKNNEESFVDNIIKRARGGDSVLAKSLLDRICPIPKEPLKGAFDLNLNGPLILVRHPKAIKEAKTK